MAKYPKGIRKVLHPSKVKAKGIKTNDPNAFLLSSLLKASPQFISGNYLAEKLKMSRVGIWSRIDKLRKTGLLIEACQNRGYRLAGEPNTLVRPLLEAWFKECKLEYPFHLLDRVDSTNSEAERLLASGHRAPFIVLSHQQEKGRGRMGRKWHSPKGGNLYLSIALQPNVELVKFRNFTLWQGVSIGKFLQKHTGVEDLRVKWPNDLLLNNRKLAGMLTEASIDCDQVRSIVFGFGLNINSSIKQFPNDLQNISTSLKEETGMEWRIHELAAKIVRVSIKASKECMKEDSGEKLLQQWEEMDFLKGQKVTIQSGKDQFSGKANGIDASGALILQARNGKRKAVNSGEVSLQK